MKSANEIIKMLRIETLARITRSLFKGLIWLGVVIGSLLAVALLISTTINLIQGRELRQTLLQLKAEGHPLTIAEIKPAPVPDDQNAAGLFKQLPRMFPGSSNTNGLEEIDSLGKLFYANSNNFDVAAWPAADREKLLVQIKSPAIENNLNLFAEASKKEFMNFNIKYEDGPSAILPNLGQLRARARIIGLSAALDAQAGNNESAFKKVLEGYKVSKLLTQEPCLVFLLVSVAVDITMKDCIQLLSDLGSVPADKATAIIKELDRHTGTQPWTRVMDAERVCMGLWLYDRIKQGSIPELADYGIPHLNYLRFYPFFNKNITIYLQAISKIQEIFAMPYYEVIQDGRLNICDQELAKYPKLYVILPSLLLLNLDVIVRNKAKHDAIVALTQTGLALKLYKQKYTAYPDALEKVTPEFIEKAPIDPFTGKALIYRKEGEGFMLYSLGPDMKDDGGTPLPYKTDETKTSYDIVWKSKK